MTAAADFIPLALCVLTVSDTRTAASDSSGDYLADALAGAGHRLHARALLPDDRYRLRAIVAAWIADPAVDGVLVTGGTGFTGRDSTPEAIAPRQPTVWRDTSSSSGIRAGAGASLLI